MKVDHKNGSSQMPGVEKSKNGKVSSKLGFDKAAALNDSSNTPNASRVDVSDRAQMAQKAKELASQNTVDEAKVARLQKMIDEGRYKTDANAISDRLVDEHMNFPE